MGNTDKIEDEYMEECQDEMYFSGSPDYDDVADDFMRADSDLWDAC